MKILAEFEVTKNLFDVSKKNILITGAAGYFGRYITRGFLESGAKVTILSRSEKLLKQSENYKKEFGSNRINSFKVDFYDHDEFKAVLEKIVNLMDVDVLINNACDLSARTGFNTQEGFLENSTYEQWKNAFESGIYWAALTTQIFGKQFISKNIKGSIINISSMYGIVAPNPQTYLNTDRFNPPGYGVSKAGIIALTRYTASFWGKHGIRCNALSPGPFANVEADGSNNVSQDDQFIDKLKEHTVLNRIGHPDEVIGALIYLASDASSFMTGHNLVIDGGWTIK